MSAEVVCVLAHVSPIELIKKKRSAVLYKAVMKVHTKREGKQARQYIVDQTLYASELERSIRRSCKKSRLAS